MVIWGRDGASHAGLRITEYGGRVQVYGRDNDSQGAMGFADEGGRIEIFGKDTGRRRRLSWGVLGKLVGEFGDGAVALIYGARHARKGRSGIKTRWQLEGREDAGALCKGGAGGAGATAYGEF